MEYYLGCSRLEISESVVQDFLNGKKDELIEIKSDPVSKLKISSRAASVTKEEVEASH